ncbi:MAG: glycosyltransferase family 2 protein [Desulfovibrio sp.]
MAVTSTYQKNSEATQPEVCAVVLNYNGKTLNERCLRSLLSQTYPALRILFVDNGSSDGSFQDVKHIFSDSIEYLDNGENLFFAAGNNRGIRQALDTGAEYVFIINNDTELSVDCVERLVECMQKNPEAGGCQPVMFDMSPDDPVGGWNRADRSIASAGIQISLSGRCWDNKSYEFHGKDRFIPVSGVTGGAMFLSAQAIDACGMFDESYVMYFEDVDLSLRLQGQSYTLYLASRARVGHLVSATTKRYASLLRIKYCEANALKLIQRHFPTKYKVQAYLLSTVFTFGSSLKWALRGRMPIGIAALSGFFSGFRSNLRSLLFDRSFKNKKNMAEHILSHIWYPPA